jgi:hypothetical protein
MTFNDFSHELNYKINDFKEMRMCLWNIFALKAWNHAHIIVWKTLMTQFLNSAEGFAIFQLQAMPPFSLHVTTSKYKCRWHEWQSKSHKAKGCTHAHWNCQCKIILFVPSCSWTWRLSLKWVIHNSMNTSFLLLLL